MLWLLFYGLVILPLQVVIWTLRLLPLLTRMAVVGYALFIIGGVALWTLIQGRLRRRPPADPALLAAYPALLAWHDEHLNRA